MVRLRFVLGRERGLGHGHRQIIEISATEFIRKSEPSALDKRILVCSE
jgi:hypothetical protein